MKLVPCALAVLTLATSALLADDRDLAQAELTSCRTLAAKKDKAGALSAADRAAGAWTKLASDSPNDPLPHVRLAQVAMECRIAFAGFMDKGRLAGEIESHLDRAISLDPNLWEARLNLGVLLYNLPPFLRRTADATVQLEKALAIDAKRSADVYFLLGELYKRAGDSAKAATTWSDGAKLFPDDENLRKKTAKVSLKGIGSGQSTTPAVQRLVAIGEEFAARPEIAGMSITVMEGDAVLMSGGFGEADLENAVPATDRTIYRLGSVSKHFVAAAILKLADRGVVHLDDPISRWLPDAPPSDITIKHLLNHTAGLPRDVEMGVTTDWIRAALEAKRVANVGVTSSYSNVGYALLGEIVEAAAGRPYFEFVREALLTPAKLDGIVECDERVVIASRAEGYSWGGDALVNDEPLSASPVLRYAGGICASSGALARWFSALRRGEILSAASTASMFNATAHVDGTPSHYGYGFRVRSAAPQISHNGAVNGFVSRIAYHPSSELLIVLLVNSESVDPTEITERLATASLLD